MKNFLLISLLTFFAASAFATTTTVTGQGQESGYCNGSQSFSCIRTIEDAAKREGTQDAEWRCHSNGGQPRTYTTNCSTYCSPNYLNPRDGNTYVQCTASCSTQCEH